MKIGYLLDTHAGAYDRPQPTREEVSAFIDQLHAEADLVEQYGFDSIQVPERHGRAECFFPSPLILLTALAERTKRIRLGTYICIPPLHNPMELAEQFAMIDQLSRGRLIMGVASGYHPGYSEFFQRSAPEARCHVRGSIRYHPACLGREKVLVRRPVLQVPRCRVDAEALSAATSRDLGGRHVPKTIARAGKLGMLGAAILFRSTKIIGTSRCSCIASRRRTAAIARRWC